MYTMSRGEGLILARTSEAENGLSAEEGQSLSPDGLGHPRSGCLGWLIHMLHARRHLWTHATLFWLLLHETQATLESVSNAVS